MEIFIYILITAVVVGGIAVAATMAVQRRSASSRARTIVADAEREAEDLKKGKVLEAREEAMKITAEAEKTAGQRMSRVQNAEAKQKQREMQLNQQQSENQRGRNELEAQRTKLNEQIAAL